MKRSRPGTIHGSPYPQRSMGFRLWFVLEWTMHDEPREYHESAPARPRARSATDCGGPCAARLTAGSVECSGCAVRGSCLRGAARAMLEDDSARPPWQHDGKSNSAAPMQDGHRWHGHGTALDKRGRVHSSPLLQDPTWKRRGVSRRYCAHLSEIHAAQSAVGEAPKSAEADLQRKSVYLKKLGMLAMRRVRH